jgi:peptide deformylase
MLKIVKLGHPVLRQKAREITSITDDLRSLIVGMKEAMIRENGLGLAAPQVGESIRLFVYKVGEAEGTLLNPEIMQSKGSDIDVEGCLSIPGVQGDVERAEEVVVVGRDENWRKVRIKARGLLARCFQHEIDHLDGILFIDKAVEGSLRDVSQKAAVQVEAAATI